LNCLKIEIRYGDNPGAGSPREGKMENTPGPWKVGKLYEGNECSILDAKGFAICSIDSTAILEDYYEKLNINNWSELPGKSYIERTEEELLAIAKLFVAAPDLLAALQDIANLPDSYPIAAIRQKAKAAITAVEATP
jgi:hypothetical protein